MSSNIRSYLESKIRYRFIKVIYLFVIILGCWIICLEIYTDTVQVFDEKMTEVNEWIRREKEKVFNIIINGWILTQDDIRTASKDMNVTQKEEFLSLLMETDVKIDGIDFNLKWTGEYLLNHKKIMKDTNNVFDSIQETVKLYLVWFWMILKFILMIWIAYLITEWIKRIFYYIILWSFNPKI
jgi:hypothetical protein